MERDVAIHRLGVVELARAIRHRHLSPVEVIDAFIHQIEERNPTLNAFVYLGFEEARSLARLAEQQVMSGDPVGPLHGVPTAIKDLFDYKPGWPSTYGGIRALRNNIVDYSCLFTERIERAGAIILGKTNSPTMGFRGTTDNYLFGPSRNPFALEKNAGGSSGGSAAAVADFLVPFAEATDAGGSIRIPAAWCGLYGFMASFGRIPYVIRPNAFGGANPFVYEGFVTRSVADAVLVLNSLSGVDGRDPFSLAGKQDFCVPDHPSLEGWKIGYSPDWDVFPIESSIQAVIEEALTAFEQSGAHVERITLGLKRTHAALTEAWFRLIIPLSIRALETFKHEGLDVLKDHREDFPPEYLNWIDRGRAISLLEHYEDLEIRTEVYDALETLFKDYDLLVMPTVGALPVDNAEDGNTMGPAEINGQAVDPLIGWAPAYLINFTGHPAASLPAGLTPEGLPVGMQIVGRRHADGDVLTASAAFETNRPWAAIYEQRDTENSR